ncbi:GNAT family N-acetyltransferase [Tissierella praeacuta]|uniref:GNAT family N-acetyltransferase n=1 Tax=Tissierella praeacuta TaxID=43131 RepID=UPI001C106B1F|nr:GNAT family N-acetyltransferase [Tissierella praeacuta]MBU5256105.1 GNAT family N-acetyltransferase [Tissierella praeacuta]
MENLSISKYIFESSRLGFRMWQESDRVLFAKMNVSTEVMRYFPKTLDSKETDDFLSRIQEHFKKNGYGLWAVELKDTKEFIGFIGFLNATFEADFTPCVEIGWRLDNEYWNKGYATEGAKACLEYGFSKLNLSSIYSFTAEINKPSQNVMKKIGLKKIGKFDHPKVEVGSPLKRHVLYKIDKKEYERI